MTEEIARLNAALEGRYSIERQLGRGGMAVVYLAHDARHHRKVALKVLDREIISELINQRFLREIRIAARLHHPHILALFDSGEADGRPFFVMPFVEGSTLRARLDREPRLPVAEAVRFGREIADALAYAHGEGVVHRDIKPENILLARSAPGERSEGQCHALVADFGIAKALGGDLDRKLTGTGLSVGTMVYMSPEQLTGSQDLDARTDQYSLGCVLYEMLIGQPPFGGGSAQASVAGRFIKAPQSVRAARPEIPVALEDVIMQALAIEPSGRFADAHRMGDALLSSQRGFDLGTAPVVTPPERTPVSSYGYRLPVAVSVILLILALTLVPGPWRASGKSTRANVDAITPVSAARTTIAVLPFASYDPGGSGEYLADGMTDELINALGKVPSLQVTSRTSAFALKGKSVTPRAIARELGVATMLEGSTRSASGELHVNARLINTSNGYTLWSGSYRRRGGAALAVQGEIAQAIVQTLRVELAPEVRARLAKKPTDSPEAYAYYLQGRFFWNKRTARDHLKAISFFNKAIAADSSFALAYSGLADVYTISAQSESSPRALLLKARDAAATSLRFDSTLAESHASAGTVSIFLDPRDTASAFASFRRAIALDPEYSTAHHWYAVNLAVVGRVDDAIRESNHAVRLNPRGVAVNQGRGLVLYLAGRLEEAEAQFRATLEINPQSVSARSRLAQVVAERGRFDDAISIARAAVKGAPADLQSRGTLGYVLARAGHIDEAKLIARELERQPERGQRSDLFPAMVYAALGNKDKSVEWLERGYEKGAVWLSLLALDPAFRTLRTDARFLRLLEQVGFPPPA